MNDDGSYTYPTNRRRMCRTVDRNTRTVRPAHEPSDEGAEPLGERTNRRARVPNLQRNARTVG